MTSQAIKGMNISKWGLKSGDSKSETKLQEYKKENAALKKSLEDIIKNKAQMKPDERDRLLEKILALETENEKYNKILGERDHEIQLLKEKLKSRSSHGDIAGLLDQLEEKTNEVAKKEQLLNSLSEEMDRLKNQLAAVTPQCTELENRAVGIEISQEVAVGCSESSRNLNEVEMQLKDALEKNNQWLIYDQQREAYVHSILARVSELEQQLKAFQLEQAKESRTEVLLQGKNQRDYEYMLAAASKDLETERHTVAQLHFELNECKRKYHEATQEVMKLDSMLKSQQHVDLQALQNENLLKEQMIQRLTHENEVTRAKLEEERTRTQAFSSQVELLHRSLLIEQEKHTKIIALEQQIQACTSDLENEKLDRQNLRHQLNKVLKLLGKSREQKTSTEPPKHPEYERIEVLHNFETAFEDKLIIQEKSSSPKRSNLLDESFLECPKCKTRYPTSQHRELLAHIDFCAD